MILLCTTCGTELFKQFLLQVMCYPPKYIIPDIPWGVERVAEAGVDRVDKINRGADGVDLAKCQALAGETALIVFVDYAEDPGSKEPRPEYFPVREAKIVAARSYAGKLLLDVCLCNFVYYDDEVRRGYDSDLGKAISGAPPPPERLWNRRIAGQAGIVKAIPTGPQRMLYADNRTWKSGGKFVLRFKKANNAEPDLAFKPEPETKAEEVEDEHDDWKSVVDRIASSWAMKTKLFYQIEVQQNASSHRARRQDPKDVRGKPVYGLSSGDRAALVVHFYFGDVDRRSMARTLLEITADPTYLSTVGNSLIDVYPEQWSGKVERLQLIVKRQLSEVFTRLRIQERANTPTTDAALATVELYLRIVPRGFYIWMILALFFTGSFLNAVPEDFGAPDFQVGWGAKVLGSVMMATAFWLGFSKLPAKGD
jgi:hypothetical protein